MMTTAIICTAAGENCICKNAEELRQILTGLGWKDTDIEDLMDEGQDILDAELVKEVPGAGLYECEHQRNTGYGRYTPVFIYYMAHEDGSVRFVEELDHKADAEELDEMCQR